MIKYAVLNYTSCIHGLFVFWLAPDVSFEFASTTVNEKDETVDIMLTLSRASSREHTIRINDESITATGELSLNMAVLNCWNL